ncbi:hypothetical protein HK101_005974, partial [Irineochytrium annulatum]
MAQTFRITIVGAGVIGLTTAVLLQSEGHKVTIIAKGSPEELTADPNYTSPKAGANWQSFATISDIRQQNWDEQTFHALWRLAFHPPAGVMHLAGFNYWDKEPDNFVTPWFERVTPGYAVLHPSHLPPGKNFGITFETVTMNVPKYLKWLLSRFRSSGGELIHNHLSHISEAFDVKKPDIVINCTGYGASTLGGVEDAKVYPTRGQTLLVRAPQ